MLVQLWIQSREVILLRPLHNFISNITQVSLVDVPVLVLKVLELNRVLDNILTVAPLMNQKIIGVSQNQCDIGYLRQTTKRKCPYDHSHSNKTADQGTRQSRIVHGTTLRGAQESVVFKCALIQETCLVDHRQEQSHDG